MINITCPSCNADMDLDVALAHDELRAAVAEIITVSLPLGRQVLRYANLFKPRKNKMRPDRLARLIGQLAPDLQRQAITHNGREWTVPHAAWEAGFNAMLERAASGKFTLPLESHGYLYATLASQADKAEGQAEAQTESDRRVVPRRDNVQIHGQTLPIGDALQVAFARRDPALAKLDADSRNAAPAPDHIKARLAALKKGGQA
ncbi:MAG: hypothetical protein QM617_05035 [Comamonas sp.]